MSRRIVIEERCSDNKWPCQCARTILTEPSEEMVERAAQSYLEDDLLAYGWDDAPLQVKEKYRIMARAALAAALFGSSDWRSTSAQRECCPSRLRAGVTSVCRLS